MKLEKVDATHKSPYTYMYLLPFMCVWVFFLIQIKTSLFSPA